MLVSVIAKGTRVVDGEAQLAKVNTDVVGELEISPEGVRFNDWFVPLGDIENPVLQTSKGLLKKEQVLVLGGEQGTYVFELKQPVQESELPFPVKHEKSQLHRHHRAADCHRHHHPRRDAVHLRAGIIMTDQVNQEANQDAKKDALERLQARQRIAEKTGSVRPKLGSTEPAPDPQGLRVFSLLFGFCVFIAVISAKEPNATNNPNVTLKRL